MLCWNVKIEGGCDLVVEFDLLDWWCMSALFLECVEVLGGGSIVVCKK